MKKPIILLLAATSLNLGVVPSVYAKRKPIDYVVPLVAFGGLTANTIELLSSKAKCQEVAQILFGQYKGKNVFQRLFTDPKTAIVVLRALLSAGCLGVGVYDLVRDRGLGTAEDDADSQDLSTNRGSCPAQRVPSTFDVEVISSDGASSRFKVVSGEVLELTKEEVLGDFFDVSSLDKYTIYAHTCAEGDRLFFLRDGDDVLTMGRGPLAFSPGELETLIWKKVAIIPAPTPDFAGDEFEPGVVPSPELGGDADHAETASGADTPAESLFPSASFPAAPHSVPDPVPTERKAAPTPPALPIPTVEALPHFEDEVTDDDSMPALVKSPASSPELDGDTDHAEPASGAGIPAESFFPRASSPAAPHSVTDPVATDSVTKRKEAQTPPGLSISTVEAVPYSEDVTDNDSIPLPMGVLSAPKFAPAAEAVRMTPNDYSKGEVALPDEVAPSSGDKGPVKPQLISMVEAEEGLRKEIKGLPDSPETLELLGEESLLMSQAEALLKSGRSQDDTSLAVGKKEEEGLIATGGEQLELVKN